MQALDLFLSSIRSPETRNGYNTYFKKYLDFVQTDDIFYGSNPRLIEQKIIEFLIDMRNKGKGYSSIHNYISAVLAFYKINDVILNISKTQSRHIDIERSVVPIVDKRSSRGTDYITFTKFGEIEFNKFRKAL